jgi:hypothetical protein
LITICRLPGQLAQQLLGDPHDVVFSVTRVRLPTRTAPIDALEGGLAWIEIKRRGRRFVNHLVFADRKLIWHNGCGHLSSCQLSSRKSVMNARRLLQFPAALSTPNAGR